jgi:hypothetical protein
MEVSEILDKWFDKTFAMYQEKAHPQRGLDLLMMGVLRYSRHCSIAIFWLLTQEIKLSAMALLRVYLELYIKLCWCLNNDPNSPREHKDQVYERFKRWDYKRLVERRNLLNKLLEATKGGSSSEACKGLKKTERCIEKYKKQRVRCMPDMWKMLKDLPEGFQELYPKVYQRFNQAVHPDMEFIRKMVVNTGEAYICMCDVDEDILELKLYLLSMSSDMNRMIRDFYGWDSAEMQKEYNSMLKQLNG